ncbi:FecCD family ABC transporter permease [Aneurinibacillus sp. REN35]|uniref:FecCD family ABC transporter permease n=1 Tax=Aneurinibacillus sp. REN35 TaxID=3237286 RepID=UPI0035273620
MRKSIHLHVSVQKAQNIRVRMALVILCVLLLVSITAAVMLGPVSISPLTVWRIALAKIVGSAFVIEPDWHAAQESIVWDIRFPRVLLGAVVGAGLAIVGVVIQALVRNSLADPYILGISSGASVAATLAILFGALSFLGRYALSLGAFLGALFSMIAVYVLAQVGGRMHTTRLLLAGVSVSIILSAVTNLIVTMAPEEKGMRDVMFWIMGSFSGAKWEYVTLPGLLVVCGLIFLLVQYRSLNALLMGEEAATTLGVNTHFFRKILFVISSLLTGVIVAVSGAIGFIGLMIPHLARLFVGSNHRYVLPVSALIGSIVAIWSDVLARMLLAPEELPVGVITALCGGPFFIWLLRRSSYSFGGGRE